MSVYVLGIVEGHNSSAALLRDGELVAVCFEERLSRMKNDFGYPRRAIEYCLAEACIEPEKISTVALVTENLPFAQIAVKREATFTVPDYIREQEEFWKPHLLEGRRVDYLSLFGDKLRTHELPYDWEGEPGERTSFEAFREVRWRTIRKLLRKTDDQIVVINHHRAHSFHAAYSAPWCHERPLLVMVSDGYGDDCSASVGVFKGGRFEFVSKSPASGLGRIYRYATLVLGMRPGVDEYKVMGLAPYAKEHHWRKAYDVLTNYLRVEGMTIHYTNPDKDLYWSLKERLKAVRFDGIAGGLQKFTEDITCAWFRNAIRETGIRDVVYSGGVSMNVKANKCVTELPEVESLFVGPSGGDETLSIGAAWAACADRHPEIRITPLADAYLGPAYSKDDARRALDEADLPPCEIIEDPDDVLVARLLAEGLTIGRALGRMEFGARSLGNRSILARADNAATVRKINDQIKNRDFWMPFAPIILAERAADYLVDTKGAPSPYMTNTFDATEAARRDLRAALHPADDTMRPQILEERTNPGLHRLLKRFEAITGLGGCLNTSFNIHDEPIVSSPADALRTFAKSALDAALIEGYLIRRRAEPNDLESDSTRRSS